ncbi:hypothetical protein BO78DRAFT_395594 [Aspergillus sclerotiicarbonarius CBS 121057]|uniref:P-loop containing nucleoside triphosphate hydrolase protein n=1 Tax=Aspergillus sclerotiicarbonarius (strain CBS 121057 / IBT 28362) TaxID=1448318 RepID=A0A319EDW7_ASPSB|nr:hypothetical protein BO78DRAFT_395594 [Aspergillus sclerotiicarbonarius CBS 121057]
MPPPTNSNHILIISGTHVTGKDTIATSLAHTYNSPFLEGEYCYNAAWSIARARQKHGYDVASVFGQTWLRKMNRIGLPLPLSTPPTPSHTPPSSPSSSSTASSSYTGRGGGISAVVSCAAMRKPHRDAIRSVMATQSVGVIFVVLQIEPETLLGRTVGAENRELEMRILQEKTEDIRLPGVEEAGPGRETIVVDALMDVDSVCWFVRGRVAEVLGGDDSL